MTIIHADILKWAEQYEGEPFHAALLDPPYGLNENEIDIQAVLADWLADREHRPRGAGFMGREWDSFIPGPRIWRAIRKHCYPGALLMAFGGTRTADLLGLALRLGGWEKVDEIDWVYGSGFPKNHNISKAIDKAAKAERPVVGTRKHQPKFDAAGFEYRKKDNGYNSKGRESFDVTTAATDMARVWEGYGTAFKPAHEPILVFRNPFKGTYAANCTRTGAGAINVDGGRVGTAADMNPRDFDDRRRTSPKFSHVFSGGTSPLRSSKGEVPNGRWPANLILSHTPACRAIGSRRVKGITGGVQTSNGYHGGITSGARHADAEGYETVTAWACAEGCPVAQLDRQSGERQSGGKAGKQYHYPDYGGNTVTIAPGNQTGVLYADSGGASRFFHQSDWAYEIEERIASADPVRYCAKASKAEREGGLDPMQIKLIGQMEIEGEETSPIYGNETPEGAARRGRQPRHGFPKTTVDDGRETPIDNPYLRGETKRRNTHPCLKPLLLTRYLATLLLPPAEYTPRRILVPFSGVASEYIGAVLAGWDEVVGVELSEEYIKIANARVAFWRALRYRLLDPSASLDIDLSEPEQPTLWDLEPAP